MRQVRNTNFFIGFAAFFLMLAIAVVYWTRRPPRTQTPAGLPYTKQQEDAIAQYLDHHREPWLEKLGPHLIGEKMYLFYPTYQLRIAAVHGLERKQVADLLAKHAASMNLTRDDIELYDQTEFSNGDVATEIDVIGYPNKHVIIVYRIPETERSRGLLKNALGFDPRRSAPYGIDYRELAPSFDSARSSNLNH